MKPKEKAENLIYYFENLLEPCFEIVDDFAKSRFKKCALITVDQVLESIPPLITLKGSGSALFENEEVIWWKQVKEEIENYEINSV